MRIAVIGTGKTGGKVIELLKDEAVAFNRNNQVTPVKLKQCDAAVVFVPGDAAASVLKPVLESGIPAVWGTTGFKWPENLNELIREKNTQWIIGSNFSMGMNLIRKAILLLSKDAEILDNPQFHIHEIHHTHKKDAPSGTAISWSEWLGKDAEISSERRGDIKGIHSLEIRTKFERITLRHVALDRALFAEGAIWSARFLLSDNNLKPGLYSFSEIFDMAEKVVSL
ncbi:MAG: 4-hydroxy-tetrahydrodipicolinate reductase [Balneolaceae bacterium]